MIELQATFAAIGHQPPIDADGFARHADQPRGEHRHGTEQQKHFNARAVAGQAAFKALAVTVGFQVAKGQLNLHAACVKRCTCRMLSLSSGDALSIHGSRSRLALLRLFELRAGVP